MVYACAIALQGQDGDIARARAELGTEIGLTLATRKPGTGRQAANGGRTVFRGVSQLAPGGQAGPAVTLKKVKQCLGRCRMSVAGYDISHTPTIVDGAGNSAYGATSIVNGRAAIQISDLALRDMDNAITTIFHEIHHANSYKAFGHTGSERAAEEYAMKKLEEYHRRNR